MVNTANTVGDNMGVHIAGMVDDTVVAVNMHKKDVVVLELVEHSEPVDQALVDIVEYSLDLEESSEGYVD